MNATLTVAGTVSEEQVLDSREARPINDPLKEDFVEFAPHAMSRTVIGATNKSRQGLTCSMETNLWKNAQEIKIDLSYT